MRPGASCSPHRWGHVHHDHAHRWLSRVEHAAITPVVEGALVRYLVRVGVGTAGVTALLEAIHDHPRIEFWPDELSYADVDLRGVFGHRQVTDAYLVASAVRRGAIVATFDQALVATWPGATVLIPD